MKQRILYFIGIIFFLGLIIVGCGLTQKVMYISVPEVRKCSNKYYEAEIKPAGESLKGPQAFVLVIINKTDNLLELDWNRTYFMKNGQTSGGFMFDGIIHKDRNNPKPPDLILPGITYSKVIWPNILVEFDKEWEHRGMGAGEFGVLLSIKSGRREVGEKMLINVVPRWR
jgi:hypothetical protein